MFYATVKSSLLMQIEASKLSMNDEFMNHLPTTATEQKLKDNLTEMISKGIKDFYRPIVDPSLDLRDKISYCSGLYPATGKSYKWWEKNALRIFGQVKTRLGSKDEYVAFLGELIKELVVSGWSISDAWSAVCNDSTSLGNYANSHNSIFLIKCTGSDEICGFFDLANTSKILAGEKGDKGFFMAGGSFCSRGDRFPIGDIRYVHDRSIPWNIAVGWIVFECLGRKER